MTTNLQNFLILASENEELFAKLQELNEINDKEVVYTKTIALAKDVDIELTMADFDESSAELSDDELTSVAGGWKTCVCVMTGGGNADSHGAPCACIIGGSGFARGTDDCRCVCLSNGYGKDLTILKDLGLQS